MRERRRIITENYCKQQAEIADCLYRKMKIVSYDSISIADICQEMQISRRAFYHYYKNKEECLEQIIYRFLEAYMMKVYEITPKGSELERTIALMEIWKSEAFQNFLDVFERNNLIPVFILTEERFIRTIDKQASAPLLEDIAKLDEDLLYCYLASDLALMRRWRERGYDTPSEEIARKYLQIMKRVG